jgi:chemosensory pili system protein ChpA (sensor histidine kinase/response regulator)
MTHASQPDLGPLNWVKGEIDLALGRAAEALEQAAAGSEPGALQFAQTHLHQARGALSIVGLDGLAQFADAVGQFLAAQARGEIEATPEKATLASRGLAAIGNYLEELAHGAPDQPLRLAGLYAEIGVARGEKGHPADLFFPDLSLRPPRRGQEPASLPAAEEEKQLKALRGRFERGLLKWLRNPAEAEGPQEMREAVAGIEARLTNPAVRALWWASLAFFDSLLPGAPTDLPASRKLCTRLDAQMRRLLTGAPPASERVLREVLHHIATHPITTEHQRVVMETFHLADLVPESGAAVRDVPLAPVIKQTRETLAGAREAWDQFSGGSAAALPRFTDRMAALAAHAKTLDRPSLTRLVEGLSAFTDWLRRDPLQLGGPLAMEVAGTLLLVESTLEPGQLPAGFALRVEESIARLQAHMGGTGPNPDLTEAAAAAARRHEQRDATAHLARELLSTLAEVEQGLDTFFRNPAQREPLAAMAAPLTQLSGALILLEDPAPQTLVEEAAATIRGYIAEPGELDPESFTALAQRLSALGFYLEALRQGPASLADFLPGAVSAPVEEVEEAPVVEVQAPAPIAVLEPELLVEEELEPELLVEEELEVAELAPIPPPSLQAQALMEAPEEALDAELLAIFMEEAHEVLGTIAEHLELSRGNPADLGALTTVRRGFHTLKGSGRMVGLKDLGEAAWVLEQTLNRWLQAEWVPTPALHQLIDDAHQVFGEWVAQLEAGGSAAKNATALVAQAERLRASDTPIVEAAAPAPAAEIVVPATPPLEEAAIPSEAFLVNTVDFYDLDVRSLNAASEEEPVAALEDEINLEGDLDAFELEAATTESAPVAQDVEDFALEDLEELEASAPALSADDLSAAPATEEEVAPAEFSLQEKGDLSLEESAPSPIMVTPEAVAETPAIAAEDIEATQALEELEGLEALESLERLESPEVQGSLEAEENLESLESIEALESLESLEDLETLENQEAVESLETLEEAVASSEHDEAAATTADAPSETVRLGDAEISRGIYDMFLVEARQHLATLRRELARLHVNPILLPPEPAIRAAHTLGGIAGTAQVEAARQLARALEHAQSRLHDTIQPPSPEQTELFTSAATTLEAMVAQVAELRLPLPVPELVAQLEGVARPASAEIRPFTVIQGDRSAPPSRPIHDLAAAAPEEDAEAPALQDDIDEQLLTILQEEGQDLMEQIGAILRGWRESPADLAPLDNLARLLHTFKGSARMAGAMVLGQFLHRLETRLEGARANPGPALIDDIETAMDTAEQMLEGLGTALAAAPNLAVNVEPKSEEAGAAGTTLRVRADLVDRFVNEAGEIGIARTRVEGELRTLRRSLLDLTENVIRLRNQLREVEIQAEVQMHSRIAQAESHHGEFDPLEMDRYTRLQELTRMMAESVGDVTTVQQTLLRNLDGADAAVGSQGRLTRDLQQALMRVRMVRFDSLIDRLYRVVRQSAKDLGKRANLDLRGGTIEIDRGVLEHMTAPLEHLLRNAVAHGIEAVQARQEAGKAEIGQITLSVIQEGNEIVLDLTDDGAGLDFARIQEKARAQGLLGADEVADEKRLTNLIFVPGFSTAGSVSAVSGRGVGMDVVKAETAAVGGRIDVHSAPGAGTQVRIYLPLTLASTQALLVRAGSRSYAIPSSMVAQVLNLKPAALEKLRQENAMEWMGDRYAYSYLPRLLGDRQAQPEEQKFNWVLLLKAGAQTLALHVDALKGNQEVVIKSAGPQLARLIGMSGATVLGDGEIVLIVNPVALASRPVVESTPAANLEVTTKAAANRQPSVLVVDDSLTVRKITGRLLEREGYRVVTAKDGVDALEKLLVETPDVILSDIEMPRMDGFDLVRNIRADRRLAAVPIIMITSRLAEKHRRYAAEIGASHYLGKPYQEDELLGLIRGYVEEVVAA